MKVKILLALITVLAIALPIVLGIIFYRDDINKAQENRDNYRFMSTQSAESKS